MWYRIVYTIIKDSIHIVSDGGIIQILYSDTIILSIISSIINLKVSKVKFVKEELVVSISYTVGYFSLQQYMIFYKMIIGFGYKVEFSGQKSTIFASE